MVWPWKLPMSSVHSTPLSVHAWTGVRSKTQYVHAWDPSWVLISTNKDNSIKIKSTCFRCAFCKEQRVHVYIQQLESGIRDIHVAKLSRSLSSQHRMSILFLWFTREGKGQHWLWHVWHVWVCYSMLLVVRSDLPCIMFCTICISAIFLFLYSFSNHEMNIFRWNSVAFKVLISRIWHALNVHLQRCIF